MYYENTPIHGVPKGLLLGQQERTTELNQRISVRQFADKDLAPNFDPRPISTKYAMLPIIDRRAPTTEIIENIPEHSVQNNFNPGTQRGPPDTFFTTVDTESTLRNLSVSMQRGLSQSVYVPSSSSSLFNVEVPSNNRIPTHPGLFHTQDSLTSSRALRYDTSVVGKNTFFNNTRVQMKNISP